MKKITFLLGLMLASSALAVGPKPLNLAIAVDMTGSAIHDKGYLRENKITFVSLLRMLTKGDTVTIIRICGRAETIISDRVSSRYLSKTALRRYRDATFINCSDKGSAITEALRKVTFASHIAVFTDGGIADDPQKSGFGKVLATSPNKNIWFSGMSNQLRNGEPMRDTVLSALPRHNRFITSGIHDIDSGYKVFTDRLREARR